MLYIPMAQGVAVKDPLGAVEGHHRASGYPIAERRADLHRLPADSESTA